MSTNDNRDRQPGRKELATLLAIAGLSVAAVWFGFAFILVRAFISTHDAVMAFFAFVLVVLASLIAALSGRKLREDREHYARMDDAERSARKVRFAKAAIVANILLAALGGSLLLEYFRPRGEPLHLAGAIVMFTIAIGSAAASLKQIKQQRKPQP